MTEVPISIALVTYKRTDMAVETIRSTLANLDYPKHLRSWYIGDDGSDKQHMEAILDELKDENLLGWHSERMRPEGHSDTYYSGMGWNKALGIAHQNSDFVLWLEDDWRMAVPIALQPYISLLEKREDVGLCTFRILSVGADVHVVGHDGIVYLQYQRTTQYGYCGHPALRHARFTKFYGWFHEERSPGEIEIDLDSRYRGMTTGPHVWRPATLDQWGGWHHIGTEKSWK